MNESQPRPRRGKSALSPMLPEHALRAYRACEASFLADTPLNTLLTVTPRHARRGWDPSAAEPIAAFRSLAARAVTRRLAEHNLPALWIAGVERSEGWGAHVHIVLSLPPSHLASLPAELAEALTRRFDFDLQAIAKENARRPADLAFRPVHAASAQHPDDGWRLVGYVAKGAFQPEGSFRATPLTVSHGLAELVRQHAPHLTHVPLAELHRHYGQAQAEQRQRLRAEAMLAAIRSRPLAWG